MTAIIKKHILVSLIKDFAVSFAPVMKLHLMRLILLSGFFAIFAFGQNVPAGAFSITRLHYEGGGDWYADPSSLPNLLEFVDSHTNLTVNPVEQRAEIGDDIFMESP